MTRAQQKSKANSAKSATRSRFLFLLTGYLREVISTYRVGVNSISTEAINELTRALRLGYIEGVKNTLGFDIRQHKQIDDDLEQNILTTLSQELDKIIVMKTAADVTHITQTTTKHLASTNTVAAAGAVSQREATTILSNYMKAQKLTIATTSAQWIVETTRRSAVVTIQDPLKNSIARIVQLIQAGDINAARRLSRQVMKLSKLPVSTGQAALIRHVYDNRARLLTPKVQGHIIAKLQARGEELGAPVKTWLMLGGPRVRDTHRAANGQQKPVDEPFELAGGQLQYPGDASLGALLNEIINCECVAAYD